MKDRVPSHPVEMLKRNRLRSGQARLFRAARQAAQRAHAPYSGFRVGAAVQDHKGRVFRGANIENAAYPLGICAERVALLAWLQQGGGPITRVAIFTETDAATPPCGLCREALVRWAADAEVFLVHRRRTSGPHRPRSWLPGADA